MSLGQFKDLTEGSANPGISMDGLADTINSEIAGERYELIVTGTKRRSIETGQKVKELRQIPAAILKEEMFDEIPSVIDQEISVEQFNLMKSRRKLEVKTHRILLNSEVLNRIEVIEGFLKSRREDRVLVISSSYIIGVLNYWFNVIGRDRDRFDAQEGGLYEIGGWLKGIQVTIN